MENHDLEPKLDEYETENEAPHECGREIGRSLAVVHRARVRRKKMGYLRGLFMGKKSQHDLEAWPLARKTIYLPLDPQTDEVAIKEAKREFLKEVEVLRHAQLCRHVIKLVGAYQLGGGSPQLVVVMERAEKDLGAFLSVKLGQSHLDLLQQWFTCLARAINDIHSLGIRHRDIKPQNILIKGDLVLLADFGISKMGLVQTLSTTVPEWARGRSVPYCAPEVDDGSSRGRAADIFSLGAVFLEMLVAHSYLDRQEKLKETLLWGPNGQPSYARKLDAVRKLMQELEVNNGSGQHGTNEWRRSILTLCQRMLQEDRDDRPPASQLIDQLQRMPSSLVSSCRCSTTEGITSMSKEAKLIEACKDGRLSEVESFLQDGVNPATVSALQLATANNHPDIVGYIVKHLLRSGADINIRDHSKQTALHCAASYGHQDIAQMLLTSGAATDYKDVDGRIALHYAAGGGYDTVVDLILDHDAKADVQTRAVDDGIQDAAGETPLHSAAKRGHTTTLKTLLNTGYSRKVDTANKKYHRTALHHSAARGSAEAVRLLLENEADPKVQDVLELTPLHLAARGRLVGPDIDYRAVIEVLVEYGADVWAKDLDGATAIRYTHDLPMTDGRKGILSRAMEQSGRASGSFTFEMIPSYHTAPDVENATKHRDSDTNSALAVTVADYTSLASFLALVYAVRLDILPITWQPHLGGLGAGASGVVNQSFIHLRMSLAFKRYNYTLPAIPAGKSGAGAEETRLQLRDAFRSFATEIRILKEPWIRRLDSILDLIGICFEVKHSDGILWPVLVFEKAPYGSLRQFMDSEMGGMSTGEVKLSLCRDLLHAVAAMHACDIIHGDLKPDNILIFPHKSGAGLIAKVMDFSFSHAGAAAKGRAVLLPCSPPWEAPEYRRGASYQIQDAKQADVFSAGLVCLWLFFRNDLLLYWKGHARAYDDEYQGLFRDDEKALCKLKVENRLYAFADRCLSEYELVTHGDKLGSDMISLLRLFWSSSLHRDKMKRPQKLSDVLSPGSQNVERPSDMDSWTRIITRVPSVDGDGGKVRAFEVLSSLPQLIQADYRLRRQLVESLESSANQGNRHDAYELALCKAIGIGTRRNAAEANQIALFRSNKSMFELEQDVKALKHGRITLAFHQALFRELFDDGYIQPFHPEVGESTADLTRIHEAYRTEIEDVESALGSNSQVVIQLKQRLAGLLAQRGQLIEAGVLHSDVEGAVTETRGLLPDFPSTWNQHGSEDQRAWDYIKSKAERENAKRVLQNRTELANSHRGRGDWTAAALLGKGVLQEMEKMLGEGHLETAAAREGLVMTYIKQRRWRVAEQHALKVLDVRHKELGLSHHLTFQSIALLASIYGCVESCRKFCPETTRSRDGDSSKQILPPRKARAEQRRQRRWKKAEDLLTSVTQSPDILKDYPVLINVESALASIYFDQQKWDFAEILERGVLEKRTDSLGPDNCDTLAARGNLALVMKMKGEVEAALQEERLVLEARKRVGSRHRDTVVAMANLAHTLMATGEEAEASALFSQVRALKKEVKKETRSRIRKERAERQNRETRRGRLRHLPALVGTAPSKPSAVAESTSGREVDDWFKKTFG